MKKNADALVATGQGLLGNNMFAYCLNNPIMCIDPYGNIPFADGFFDEAFQELGRLLYELLTGKQHPDRMYEHLNVEVIQAQTEYVITFMQDEDFSSVRAAGRMSLGIISTAKGVALILAPVPTETDDLWGVYKFVKGVINFFRGLAELIGDAIK